MNLSLRHRRFRTGLETIRYMPAIAGWITSGCTGIAPPPVKRMVLSAYRRRYHLHQFIETGTYEGETLAYMARDHSVKCTSIELAENYYRLARTRFESYANVNLIQGDSGAVLPQLVRTLDAPALFWLDGHYSGGATARGELDTPVSTELQAILDSPVKNHVILVDDARLFDGTNSYPHLDSFIQTVRQKSAYHVEVSIDIIRITPEIKTT